MGENARQPDAPKYADTPMELLTPREGEGFTWLHKNWIPYTSAAVGFGAPMYRNYFLHRPFWAGIHQCFLFGFAFYWVAKNLNDMMLESDIERDAALRHYVSLHPEEFPPYERKRLKEYFVPWYPIR